MQSVEAPLTITLTLKNSKLLLFACVDDWDISFQLVSVNMGSVTVG